MKFTRREYERGFTTGLFQYCLSEDAEGFEVWRIDGPDDVELEMRGGGDIHEDFKAAKRIAIALDNGWNTE